MVGEGEGGEDTVAGDVASGIEGGGGTVEGC
jgi:hypothetical protein